MCILCVKHGKIKNKRARERITNEQPNKQRRSAVAPETRSAVAPETRSAIAPTLPICRAAGGDKQTNIQTNKQTNRQTNKYNLTNKQTDKQTRNQNKQPETGGTQIEDLDPDRNQISDRARIPNRSLNLDLNLNMDLRL
jgi:hypothetical protein